MDVQSEKSVCEIHSIFGFQPNGNMSQVLYHGTSVQYVTRIEKEGLVKQKRHHVHLSTDEATALQVGQRHGKPVIFEVQAANMYAAGYAFYVSANAVWLTDVVPAAYLKRVETATGSIDT